MHYLPRQLTPMLRQALSGFPAVLVTGPRQSGKTTLLKRELPEAAYVSFDDPLERDSARADPEGFLNRFGGSMAILDEVQYVPELFQYLKIRIDRDPQTCGRWILTGSQQFALMAAITETLAGRLAILELLPLSFLELPPETHLPRANEIWLGGYPVPRLYPERRDLWMSSYVQTYVERDVRQLHSFQDLRAFENFVALCASRHGQELNMAALSRAAGVSQPTIKSWLGALEAGYLIYLLSPYFENLGKRVVRSPKLYVLDSGLACTLTRQPGPEAALAGAMGGAFLEGWVVAETLKLFAAAGKSRTDLYFWRSHDGLEVDLLVRLKGRLIPIEVKLTATPTLGHLEPLQRFRTLAGDRTGWEGLLVCGVSERRELPHGSLAIPWSGFPSWLEQALTEE